MYQPNGITNSEQISMEKYKNINHTKKGANYMRILMKPLK